MTSVGNLGAALGATHVTAVKVVAGLERRGLVERVPSPWDGRVTLLRLTAAGEEAVSRLGDWERALERSLSGLAPRDRAALEPALGAVVASLRDAGVIVVAEPCRGCRYFDENRDPGAAEPHRCRLIERFISERESRLDCPDHLPVAAA